MKSIRTRIAAVMTLSLFSCAAGRCAYYQWEDKAGKVHWGNHPPEDGTNVKVQKLKRTFANDGPQVVLYGTSWCGYCIQAREYLRARGVVYSEFDIDNDQAAADRAQALGWGGGLPFIVIDGHPVEGFFPSAYNRWLPPLQMKGGKEKTPLPTAAPKAKAPPAEIPIRHRKKPLKK